MVKSDFFELIEANPVIAAVKDDEGLNICCSCEDIKVVFILYGDICSIGSIVNRIKQADKIAMVHVDLMEGLSGKDVVVDFIKSHTCADGIISTRTALIRHAKDLGLYTVLRTFILDSLSYENIPKQMANAKPDMIEILPGLMPKIIRRVAKIAKVPVIAGGLISEKEDVMNALSAGAISVSSTNAEVWKML